MRIATYRAGGGKRYLGEYLEVVAMHAHPRFQ
jgi:hypothetical protein